MLLLRQPFRTGRVTVKARRTGGSEGFLLFFGAEGPERFLFCNYGAAGNQFSAIQGTPADGIATKGGGERRGAIENGRWYELTLIVTENSAEMLLDGQRVSRIEAESLPTFFATAGYRRQDGEVVVKATNYGAVALRTTIRLANAKAVGPRGRHVVIAGPRPDAENSLDQPDLIRPVDAPLLECAPTMEVTLPPHSVHVLRIPAR
jgi:alpha-L-arabinofuranosidase